MAVSETFSHPEVSGSADFRTMEIGPGSGIKFDGGTFEIYEVSW